MSSQPQWLLCVGTCFVLTASGGALRGQGRFEAVARDVVAAVPGIQVVTIRDNALNACYTMFVIDSAAAAQTRPPIETRSVQDVAAERDRRLSELSTELEQTLSTAVPGRLGPNILNYEWEGLKAQSEFERVLREKELTRLEASLKQIADAPKLVMLGPAPCSAPPPSSPGKQR